MAVAHFDAVVVGSGFGGAVTAYRLAEAGWQVCLLERGNAYPPRSFPRSPYQLVRNFWDPSEGLYGLYNVWSFHNLEAVIASALGGGSLIYANVLIRKDEKWFVQEDLAGGGFEYWPVTRADLEPHYEQVEQMLNAQRYPFRHEPYARTAKTHAFREAAERLNLIWELPKLAITFANDGEVPRPGMPINEAHPNLHNETRFTCRLCGECDIGCNYGSKNTLDYNYLSEAVRLGADVRTLCEVRRFAPRSEGGYIVQYVRHEPDLRAGKPFDTSTLPLHTITANHLILSAGALGTPYLLLKNRAAFPHLSPALGARFNLNGDYLGFVMRSREERDGKLAPRVVEPGTGPVITSAIRVPDLSDGGHLRGHYIEDAGYPQHVNWVVEGLDAPGKARRTAAFLLHRLQERLGGQRQSDLSAEISLLLGTAQRTATSMPLLGMGRDVPEGLMRLDKNGYLEIEWTGEQSAYYFKGIERTMRAIATALNGRFMANPTALLHRGVTAHPLGGCPMGRHAGEGVVNSYGEVFNYPGLHIADGSVMPGPVGPNPALTIAALADRFATHLIEQ